MNEHGLLTLRGHGGSISLFSVSFFISTKTYVYNGLVLKPKLESI
jgi:hypothetical protein